MQLTAFDYDLCQHQTCIRQYCVVLYSGRDSSYSPKELTVFSSFPENSNLKRYMHPSVPSSTIYSSQDMEAT